MARERLPPRHGSVPRAPRKVPDAAQVYNVSNVPRRQASRPASTVRRAGSGSTEVAGSSVFAYLKVFGLNQYARAFVAAGLSDLELLGRLTETETLDFLEELRIYPGHKLRLLRAMEFLRHGAKERHEDDEALRRWCLQREELSREKLEAENEVRRLREENRRLMELVAQQSGELQTERDRVVHLEDLVRAQTEQVQFLANQLHALAVAGGPNRVSELFESFKKGTLKDESEPRLPRIRCNSDSALSSPLSNTLGSYEAQPVRGQSARSRLAKSMEIPSHAEQDKADMPLIKCLATALHNKIILAVGRPRPHHATVERLAACSIFLEPVCREMLERQAGVEAETLEGSDTGTPSGPWSSLSSPFSKDSSRPCHPLNAIAIRRIPNKWDIYDFLELVIRSLEVHPEVSVVTLVYLDRFCSQSGVAFTPDNWQRLTISAMMLASKVWYDESYENLDFAEKFDLYTLHEINTFERIFLKCVSYDMSVRAVQYAQTYFFLRTLGANDSQEFTLQPLDDASALRLQERCLAKQIEFKKRYTGEEDFSVTTAF